MNFIQKFFKKLFGKRKRYGYARFKFKRRFKIKYSTQKKAVIRNNQSIRKHIRKYGKGPTRYKLGAMIINTSHRVRKYGGPKNSGHWIRQIIRQYLFSLYGIKYTKR